MSTDNRRHNRRRHVIAQFVLSIPEKGRWWCRLPHLNASTSRPKRLGIEKLIPHVGHIFGLEEEATAIILFKFGLLNVKPSVGTVMNKKGWKEVKAT